MITSVHSPNCQNLNLKMPQYLSGFFGSNSCSLISGTTFFKELSCDLEKCFFLKIFTLFQFDFSEANTDDAATNLK